MPRPYRYPCNSTTDIHVTALHDKSVSLKVAHVHKRVSVILSCLPGPDASSSSPPPAGRMGVAAVVPSKTVLCCDSRTQEFADVTSQVTGTAFWRFDHQPQRESVLAGPRRHVQLCTALSRAYDQADENLSRYRPSYTVGLRKHKRQRHIDQRTKALK